MDLMICSSFPKYVFKLASKFMTTQMMPPGRDSGKIEVSAVVGGILR